MICARIYCLHRVSETGSYSAIVGDTLSPFAAWWITNSSIITCKAFTEVGVTISLSQRRFIHSLNLKPSIPGSRFEGCRNCTTFLTHGMTINSRKAKLPIKYSYQPPILAAPIWNHGRSHMHVAARVEFEQPRISLALNLFHINSVAHHNIIPPQLSYAMYKLIN